MLAAIVFGHLRSIRLPPLRPPFAWGGETTKLVFWRRHDAAKHGVRCRDY